MCHMLTCSLCLRACKLYVSFIKAHINFHLALSYSKKKYFYRTYRYLFILCSNYNKNLLGIVFNFFFRLYSELFLSTLLKIY